MPAKSVTVSDDVYNRIYRISQDEKKNTAKVMGEIIETTLDDEIYLQLFQIKNKRNISFTEILKEVIEKGLKE